MDELCDRRGEFAQRLQNHEIDVLVGLLHDPRVRSQSEDLDVPSVGIADLPGGAIVRAPRSGSCRMPRESVDARDDLPK